MKTKRSYRQGSLNTDKHPYFKKGQIIDIISETKDLYLVQSFITGQPELIKKEDIKLND
jgi:hypothetical protein